jgi:hypothetical protein
MTPVTPSKNFGVSQLQPAVALLRILSGEINGSEMNEKDGDEKCRTRTSIESVDGQNIRQVTLPLSNEHEPKFAAKRTLFGKSIQHQETVRSNESKGNLQNKRVKRSLDFELPLNIIASPESKDNGLSDSKNCHFAPMKCLLLKWSTVEIKVSMSLSFRRLSLPLDVMIQTISPS